MKELAGNFIVYLENERGLSPRTVKAYRRDLGQFFGFCTRLEITDLAVHFP
mgnify:CR=1 FL=1